MTPEDVPLFTDLHQPAGAERIPITVPTREELLAELAQVSECAATWYKNEAQLFEFLSRVVLVCEQARVYLGDREP